MDHETEEYLKRLTEEFVDITSKLERKLSAVEIEELKVWIARRIANEGK